MYNRENIHVMEDKNRNIVRIFEMESEELKLTIIWFECLTEPLPIILKAR